MVKTIQVSYGKVTKDGKKKQSIFYKYSPFWGDLEVHQAINDMHLKKNIFGNTIRLLQNHL